MTSPGSSKRSRGPSRGTGSTSSTPSSRPGETAPPSTPSWSGAPTPNLGAGPTVAESDRLGPPDPVRIEAAIVAAFQRSFRSTPNPDAEIGFDDHASPWYTIAEVRSPDRPGLLQDLAAAMTSAGVNVHSARLLSTAGTAVNRFELTDTNGRKLDDPLKAGAIRAVHEGAAAKRTRSRWWKAAPLAFAGRRSPG